MPIKVLLADDHPMFRYGLRAALADVDDLVVAGEAADGRTATAQAQELGVDVVLMDLDMPGMNGIDAIRELRRRAPSVAVLVLTMFDNDESLFTAMRAGARGYLVKGAEQEQIVRAVRAVVGGEVVFGAGIAERALAYFTAAPESGRAARPLPELTDREMEVLRLVADGLNNAEIARRLFLSEKTVRNHVSSIFAKLRVDDRSQAIVRARRVGLGSGE
ncbi:response regulator transcription factor [Planotetraspora phitsanulokensis]|uniref:DNA-binding response regulator n=1 Tax=Planotetraspora phitsanulokensis TaxID=575192 RepID=A0A8J3XKW2_9ACTN|nr:response regulator transcription factor [Planotetraspora phitsanulokensis]GII40008.1 DNA-binding response regulator [Planotetraspora phitsanulokensis]